MDFTPNNRKECVNGTKQAKHKNTIYCNGMPLFEFGSCW